MVFKKYFLMMILASMCFTPTVQKANAVDAFCEGIAVTIGVGLWASALYGGYLGYKKIEEYKGYKVENEALKAQIACIQAEPDQKKSEIIDTVKKGNNGTEQQRVKNDIVTEKQNNTVQNSTVAPAAKATTPVVAKKG